jgi:hypothetical protein
MRAKTQLQLHGSQSYLLLLKGCKGLETERGERREGHKGTKWMKEQKNRVEGAVLSKGGGREKWW